ncbi:T-cell surface glycoprotein CD8 alpha chain-like [Myiozetetes cayanensis]|uniref:T-cell surface glycoprotein CD8 alpha chain-like n=1 Tax=Myiozetetes cayanensis TaxID=478635 RepID=UPI00215E8D98|nr:T-cell surface glycoprotein CD8 alpha chain-like [Myiozetetes cayanensis]
MDGSPALLLLLALGLCCPGIRGRMYQMKVRFRDSITQLRVGQRLELECQTDGDRGAFWVRQDSSGTLHFIVFISSVSRVTFKGSQRQSTRFEAGRDNRFYRLVVKSFTQQDEGIYFCLMNINQMLYFSNGQPAFLPVSTTPGPSTQPRISGNDSYIQTPDPESSTEKELKFSCDGVIGVPSAGACLLLLTALAITILQCRSKTHHKTGRQKAQV